MVVYGKKYPKRQQYPKYKPAARGWRTCLFCHRSFRGTQAAFIAHAAIYQSYIRLKYVHSSKAVRGEGPVRYCWQPEPVVTEQNADNTVA